jgi:3-dehydroquinate synthetase
VERKVDRIEFKLDGNSFDYFIGSDCSSAAAGHLLTLRADKIFVITDKTVADLHAAEFTAQLRSQGQSTALLIHESGEQNKRLTQVENLLGSIFESGASRESVIVAMGGGLTGNLAGMCAALAYRGLRLVHIPTTLLAMLDSVLSLKQAVNSLLGKNLIGAYHRPAFVLCDTSYLKSLPTVEIKSGLCEVVKNLLAICPEKTDEFSRSFNPAARYGEADLRRFIEHGIASKLSIMAHDAYEKGRAIVLEYGHTVGHAIESAAAGKIGHGQAIGLGMLAAANISLAQGKLTDTDYARHEQLLNLIGAPLRISASMSAAKIFGHVLHDNKRGHIPCRAENIAMVLLSAIGKPCYSGDKPLVEVPLSMVKQSIETLMER